MTDALKPPNFGAGGGEERGLLHLGSGKHNISEIIAVAEAIIIR